MADASLDAVESPGPQLTRTGRRKKPDRWANELKRVSSAHEQLLKQTIELEQEQRSLQAKESMLLQVLGNMQTLVADAFAAPTHSLSDSQSGTPADTSRPESADEVANRLMWLMVVDAVQKREQEINRMYGDLLASLYPGYQRQLNGVSMLKLICSPEHSAKLAAMTEQQITFRLSTLAGKIALQVLGLHDQHPAADPAGTHVPQPLHEHYMEFSSLVMGTMVWHNSKFRSILDTNLDTQEPFGEEGAPLSAEHWLHAVKQLQLTDEQLHVLSTLHDMHFWTRRLQVRQALHRNMQQQDAHTAAVAAVLQQDEVSTATASREGGSGAQAATEGSSPTACGASPGNALMAAALQQGQQARPAGAAAQDPFVRFEQLQQSQEVLVEERQQLMRRWVLLGLHVAIVTCCTLSTYQQAVFVAASYPSVPRIDLAMLAVRDQQKAEARQQEGLQQQQQQQQAPSVGRKAPRAAAASASPASATPAPSAAFSAPSGGST